MSNILRGLEESSLADQMMQAARAAGLKPRLAGTPEQERERTQQMLKQREVDRANQPRPTYSPEQIENMKQQLAQAKRGFDPNYEYSDDYGFWKQQSEKSQTIRQLTKILKDAGAELDETKEADYGDEYQQMVKRVGQKAKEGPRKTVYDPVTRKYKTVPVKQSAIKQGVKEAKADPTSTWVVYDGHKLKRFKTHEGAKAYAEQHGGKVASSAHYADKIQGKQGVAEGTDDKEYRNWNEYEYELQQKASKALEYLNEIDPSIFTHYGDEFLMNLAGKISSENPAASVMQVAGGIVRHIKQGINEGLTIEELNENLHQWFKEKWVRFGPDGKIRGACARGDDSEGKPKCLPQAKAHALGKKGRKYAASKKRREDPNPERRGPAKNVATKKKSNEGVTEDQLNELDMWAPVTTFIKIPNGSYIQAEWRRSQGNPGLNDSASFIKFKPVNPNVVKQLGLDNVKGQKTVGGYNTGTIAQGGQYQGSGPLSNRRYEVVDYSKPETMQKLPDEIKSELVKWVQKQGVAEGRENYNGLNLLLQKDDEELFVKASAGGRELGHVLFVIDGDTLSPQDLEVDERYRGQGIAKTMYDYVKSKGYKIRRSGQQTDAGKGFWAKHRPEQNVWEQGVAEGKMAELEMDLEDSEISDNQFEKMYGMTRKEAREQFSKTDMWAFPEIRDPNKPLHEQGVKEADQLDELKCWPGYTRVQGVPAGAPGSCKKKTNEEVSEKINPETVRRLQQMLNKKFDANLDVDGVLGPLTIKSIKKFLPKASEKKAPNPERTTAVQGNEIKEEKCPECGGPMFSEIIMNEKKDACYYKVKSRYKVWPSAYASGALVKCRKKGAKNWGTGGKKDESVEEGQIYSGGNKQAGMRWYKPRSAPNQNELSKKESAIMKGLQLEGNDEEHQTGGSLGTPYPTTYEQETLPYRTKGQRRTQSIAFEDEQLDEKWSEKYKQSIDCNNPKGFSQRAHCQGKKKK